MSAHCFIKKLLRFLSDNIDVTKVFYFSDGAFAQYKNTNLAFHIKDFKMEAEWHLFATADGKGLCDGMGGTVKRIVARASLQRPLDDQIQTHLQFSKWAKIPTFQYTDKAEVQIFYLLASLIFVHNR